MSSIETKTAKSPRVIQQVFPEIECYMPNRSKTAVILPGADENGNLAPCVLLSNSDEETAKNRARKLFAHACSDMEKSLYSTFADAIQEIAPRYDLEYVRWTLCYDCPLPDQAPL